MLDNVESQIAIHTTKTRWSNSDANSIITEIMDITKEMLSNQQKGAVEEITIMGEEGNIYITPFGNNITFIITTKPNINYAMLNIYKNDLVKQIHQILKVN